MTREKAQEIYDMRVQRAHDKYADRLRRITEQRETELVDAAKVRDAALNAANSQRNQLLFHLREQHPEWCSAAEMVVGLQMTTRYTRSMIWKWRRDGLLETTPVDKQNVKHRLTAAGLKYVDELKDSLAQQ